MRLRLSLLGLLLGLIALLPAASQAAAPGAGTVSPATPSSSSPPTRATALRIASRNAA